MTERDGTDLDALLGALDAFRAWMSDYVVVGPPATAPGVQLAMVRWDREVQPAVIAARPTMQVCGNCGHSEAPHRSLGCEVCGCSTWEPVEADMGGNPLSAAADRECTGAPWSHDRKRHPA